MSTRSITVTAVAAAVLAIGGGTALAMGAGAERPAAAVTPASSQQQLPPPVPAAPGPAVDRGTAEQTARQVAGGGVVTKTELDDRDDDGDPREWEVDVRNGNVLHEIEMNAVTGEVTEHDQHGLRDDDGRDDRAHGRADDRGAHHDDDRNDDHGGDRDDDRSDD